MPQAVGRLFFGGSAASWLAAWWRGDDSTNSTNSDKGNNSDIATAASASASSGDGDPDYFSSPRTGPKDSTNDNGGTTGASAIGSDKDKVRLQKKQEQRVNGSGSNDVDDDDLDARIITEIESDILDVFSDAYCNKHVMYGALELILVRLIPELAEKGVMELWEERLS